MIRFQRYTPTDIHWQLIHTTEDPRDADVYDSDGLMQQALFCPYYVTLEGCLGADWGVIVNPDSVKFAHLVFEHAWCGCPGELTGDGWQAHHGEGAQTTDEWALPPSQRPGYRRLLRWRHKAAGIHPQ